MTGIVPQIIAGLRARPGFVQYVRHAYSVAGYDIVPNVGLALDDLGLEWVRTFNLRERKTGVEFRVIDPEDLHVLVDVRPTDDDVRRMYGWPGAMV